MDAFRTDHFGMRTIGERRWMNKITTPDGYEAAHSPHQHPARTRPQGMDALDGLALAFE
jgi:hypothetical protein